GFYAARQNWGRAKTLASELAVQFPNNVGVLDAQGRVLAGSGELDRAIEVYRRAYELTPDSAPIFSRYLSLLATAKRFPEYRTELQSRVEKEPSNRDLKAQLIRVEAEIGGIDAGLVKAQNLAKQDPDSSLYDIVSAELYEKNGRRSDAISLLEKSASSHPADDGAPI